MNIQNEHHHRRMAVVQSCLEEGARGSLHNQGMVFKKGLQMRNYKKEALQEARFTEIERENRILLERMANIMKNGNQHNPHRPRTVQPGVNCKYDM